VLEAVGLSGLATGEPTRLYHGTTASFREFDPAKCRRELVDPYYDADIFLTPSWDVAARYAWAARNAHLPASIMDDLAARNGRAAGFLRSVHARYGPEVWEAAGKAAGYWRDDPAPGEGKFDYDGFTRHLGVDPNDLADVARYIEGAARPPERDDGPFDIFLGAPNAMQPWVYDAVDRIGLDSAAYRPKVYTVEVTAREPAVAWSMEEARGALDRGHDCLVYLGPKRVGDVPEVALRDPARVRVVRVDLA
jgi:hypothetical protein